MIKAPALSMAPHIWWSINARTLRHHQQDSNYCINHCCSVSCQNLCIAWHHGQEKIMHPDMAAPLFWLSSLMRFINNCQRRKKKKKRTRHSFQANEHTSFSRFQFDVTNCEFCLHHFVGCCECTMKHNDLTHLSLYHMLSLCYEKLFMSIICMYAAVILE